MATRHKKVETEPRSTILYRSETNKVFGGVCGGLGEVFQLDPTLIRALFAVAFLFGGTGLLFYLILWIVIPSESKLSQSSDVNIRENFDEMKERAQSFTKDLGGTNDNSRNTLGILLVLLGIFFLMGNFGFSHLFNFQRTWPVLFIVVGFVFLTQKRNRK